MTILQQALLLTLLIGTGSGTKVSQPRCNSPLDRGPCNEFSIKWYYDRYSHRCREFYYGGCQGNLNRFDTLEECKDACNCEEEDPAVAMCTLPFDKGNCTSEFERWYFDMRINQCVCGTWSGCGGNSNRFYSYEHCMKSCGQFAVNSGAPSQPGRHVVAGVQTFQENTVPVGNVTWTKLFHRQRSQYVEDPTSGKTVIVAVEHHTGAVRNGKLINEHRYKYSSGNNSLPADYQNMNFTFPPIPDPMHRKQGLPPVPGAPAQMISQPSRNFPQQDAAGHHQPYPQRPMHSGEQGSNRPQAQPHVAQPGQYQQPPMHSPHPPQPYVPQPAPNRPANPHQPSPYVPPRYPQAQPHHPNPQAPRYPQHPPMIPPQAPLPHVPQRPQTSPQQPSPFRYPVVHRPQVPVQPPTPYVPRVPQRPTVHPEPHVPRVPQAPHRPQVPTPRPPVPYPPQNQQRLPVPPPQTPSPYVPRITPPPPAVHQRSRQRVHDSRFRFPVKSSHPIRTTQATIPYGQPPRVPPAVVPRSQIPNVPNVPQIPPTVPPHPHVNRPPVPQHPSVMPPQIPHPQVPQVTPGPRMPNPQINEQELRERERIERERRKKLKKDALFAKLKQQENDWKLQQRVKNLKNGQTAIPRENEKPEPQQPIHPQPKIEPPRPTPPRAPIHPVYPPQPLTPPPQPYYPKELTTAAPVPPPTTTRPTTTPAPTTTTTVRITTTTTPRIDAVPHADKKLDKQTNQPPRNDDSYSEEYMDDGREEYEDVPDALQFFLRNKNKDLLNQVETTDAEPADGYVYADDETDNNWMETDLRPNNE